MLRRVFEDGAYAEKALQAEAGGLDARDRALAMRLAYGAVQRAGTSDHLIERLAGRPSSRIDAPLLASLRLGLYELLYLGGSPDYAVVADAVELAKAPGGRGHGLVNAVLRRAAREGGPALLGKLDDHDPRGAAVAHSHPEWIAQLWWESLGPDQARALMARDNEPAELALRANELVCGVDELAARLGVATHRDPRIPEALVLDEAFDVHGSPLWSEGAFTAQSRAAMLVARTLGAAARRGRPRPLRGPGWQEHPSRGADGRRGQCRGRRGEPAARASARADRAPHAGPLDPRGGGRRAPAAHGRAL